ncbi:hypothetical protein V8C35DRAFT_285643 [Trichoderma chlorosporum]
MLIANTDPHYCDIALRTHKLVFLETPHRAADIAAWEEILNEMMLSSGVTIKGRRSQVLAELSISVDKVASYFLCAMRYQIANLFAQPKVSLLLNEMRAPKEDYLQTPALVISKEGNITEAELRDILFPKSVIKDRKTSNLFCKFILAC